MAQVDNISETVAAVVARIDAKNVARESALTISRAIIRNAAVSIRALHRREFDAAETSLEEGKTMLFDLKRQLADWPSIYYAGYVQDAQKEYTEARLAVAMVLGRPLPSPDALAVEDAPYLNGMAEAASELRRYILDILRRDDWQNAVGQAEMLLDTMDEVYSQLITVDYPDVLTGGLRRTTDQVRGVLERTRGDLTLAIRQQSLQSALEAYAPGLGMALKGANEPSGSADPSDPGTADG